MKTPHGLTWIMSHGPCCDDLTVVQCWLKQLSAAYLHAASAISSIPCSVWLLLLHAIAQLSALHEFLHFTAF